MSESTKPTKTKTVAVGTTDTASFEVNVDLANGDRVSIEVTYPKDHGLSAIMALSAFGNQDKITGLLSILRRDPQVAKHLEDHGLGFESDDEEDYL